MKKNLQLIKRQTKSLFLWGLLVLLNFSLTEAFGQANTTTTLPVSLYGGPWAINNKPGFEMFNLGADYTTNLVGSTTGGSAKFDGAGDYIKVSFNVPEGSIPGDLTYSINLANASSTASLGGVFVVEESADGVSYSPLKTYTNDLRVVSGGLSSSHEMRSTTRFVKFTYASKSGSQYVQLDAIKLSVINGPEISVQQGTTDYLTSSTYAFGNQNINTTSSAINFSIQNKRGATDLTLSNISITGTNAGDFVLNQSATAFAIAPDASTNFTVSFAPTTTGTKTADLIIKSNDSDEANYLIKLSGTGNILAPVITEVNPTSGPELSTIIITGENLINTTEVRFNGQLAGFKADSDTKITATVPRGASSGPITVKNNNTTASGPIFNVVVQPAPEITSFDPTEGTVGSIVTIYGQNFQNATIVSFNGTPATVSVNADGTQITTTVPDNATSGPISITTPGGTVSSTGNFTILLIPIISSISPDFGAIGETVTITGENLIDVTEISFNGTPATYFWEDAGAVYAEVPVGANSGPITIKTQGGSATSAQSFTVILVAPYISNISPLAGEVGEIVTISGANFADFTDISFNGTSAEFMWEDGGQLFAEVPAGAITGPITVTTPGGPSNQSAEFTVIYPVPTIASINPTKGTVGQYVTITGTNFKYVTNVSFNGTQDINAAVDSETQITAQVPVGATTGAIMVTTLGGSATSEVFTVEVPNTTYTWNVTSGNWTDPNSWEPVRNTVTNADILIFDGSKISNPTVNLDFTSSQTIGQIQFKNSGIVNLNVASDKILNLDNGIAGPDFLVGSGTTVNITNSVANAKLDINITTGETGLIEGALALQGGAGSAAHSINTADTDGLIVQGIFRTTPNFTGNPFGTTSLNSVRFVSNSVYENDGGGSPFGAEAPNAVVLFDAGSLYRQRANSSPDLNNRVYSNFEVNNSTFSQTVAGTGNLTLNNLTVSNAANFNINLNGIITITGNINVATGALNFVPATVNAINMSGTGVKTITGNGILALGTNARLNVPAGVVVDLRKQITGTGNVVVTGTVRTNVQAGFAAGENTALHSNVTPVLNAGSIIDYNGSGNQNISAINYANLVVSGTRTLGSAITLVPGTIKVSEAFTNPAVNVSYSATDNTVEFNGSAQVIPVLPYNNLTAAGAASKSIAGNLQVNGVVHVSNQQNSTINTGANKITLNNSASLIESQTSYVMGTVEATRNVTAGATQNFGGIGLTLAPVAGSVSPGSTKVVRSTGIGSIQLNEERQSIARLYDITAANSSGLNTAITLKYAPAELLAGQDEAKLNMYKKAGEDPWLEQVGNYVRNSVQRTVTLSGVTGFSAWTLGEQSAILPVELVAFTATRRGQNVQLNWATAMELNNKGFEVQVSTDAQTFEVVSFVASKNSNAKELQQYSFIDNKTKPADVLYYRLKQVDFDGTESYSPVKAVTFDNEHVAIEATAYPNPFTDKFTVVVNADAQKLASITITDALGKKVMEKTITLTKGSNDIDFNLGSQYPAGIYIINLTTNNFQQHLRMVKK